MWSSVWTVSLLTALGWASDDFACRRPFYVKYASYGLFSYGLFTRNLLRRTAFPKTTNGTNETISSGDTAVPHTSPPFKVLHEKFNVGGGYSEISKSSWEVPIEGEIFRLRSDPKFLSPPWQVPFGGGTQYSGCSQVWNFQVLHETFQTG